MEQLKFDLVLHLAGDQIIPNYMGIKLCDCPMHVIVFTKKTKGQYDRLRNVVRSSVGLIEMEVPSHDYSAILSEIKKRVGPKLRGRVGFNITGGTKPMSVAALDFCRANEVTPFYIDTENRAMAFFKEPFERIPLPQVFSSISEFIELAGHSVSAPGFKFDYAGLLAREKLTKLFWANRSWVRKDIGHFAASLGNGNPARRKEAYDKALGELLKSALGKEPEIISEWKKCFPAGAHWQPAAKFAAGGWFEEYIYLQLRPLLDSGEIRDARLGLRSGWAGAKPSRSPFDAAQEFDVVFTNGFELTVLECKAGIVKQEHIQKLGNIRLGYGGSFGKAGLVAADVPHDPAITQRIADTRGIVGVFGTDCEKIAEIAKKVGFI